MKKIGSTLSGSLIVEMSEDEFRRVSLLPARDDLLAIDVIKTAAEKGTLSLYNYRTFQRLFDDGVFAGLTAVQMLEKIEQAKPRFRLREYSGLNPRTVKILRDILSNRSVT